MKSILVIFFLGFISIFANENIDELYKKALIFENQKDYKNAMLIYKEIAKKEQEIKKSYLDEDKEKEIIQTKKIIDTVEDKSTNNTIFQMLNSSFDLYPYEENYLLPFSYISNIEQGKNNIETKFQISVKKPISFNLFGLNESLNFGYTQTSWWQLYSASAPFRETNYKPEIFMVFPYGKKNKTSLKALKIGLLHESNGQETIKSRSWNRIYAQSFFQFSNLFFNPRIWIRIPEDKADDDNDNIQEYLGYGDLNFILPYKTHSFKFTLRNNLDINGQNKGFAQVNWEFPIYNSKNSFGYIQLSNGYGDSLIDYNKNISRFSFGISLSR